MGSMRTTLAWLLTCLSASQASAGTISLQISHRTELREGELHTVVTLSNGGDEAAHAVTPVLRFRGAEVRGATQATLPPGQPLEVSLAVPSGPLTPGHWPYEIAVDYADANLYPFQALSAATLAVGSPPLPKVQIPPLDSSVLADETEFSVRVKNISAAEHRVTLKVLAPEAIEVRHASGEMELGPWKELDVPVELTNRAALPGSRYALFVMVEYEDGSVHQTLIAQTNVDIRPADAWLGPRGRYLWIGTAVFGVLFVALVAFRLLRR